MDPADVAKVMRPETPEWIKSASNPLVASVNKGLFGGWEGNWMAYNVAHDVVLPRSKGPKLGFLMYPVAETAAGASGLVCAGRLQVPDQCQGTDSLSLQRACP